MKSFRIDQLINLSSQAKCLADIGSDHGFYALQALKKNICQEIVVCDIAAAPLQRSIDLFLSENIAAKDARFFLSDGLLSVPDDLVIDAACIAGLSGQTIISIIKNSTNIFRQMDYILLQPMQKTNLLRQWLASSGFIFLDESICVDKAKFFAIMKVKFTGNTINLTEFEKLLGPLNVERRSAEALSLCKELLKRKKNELFAKQSGKIIAQDELDSIAHLVEEMEDYLR